MQNENEIREDLSKKVFEQFDQVIVQKLYSMNQTNTVELNAQCTSYNNCDDVWKFCVTSCEIKGETFREISNNCRIIALDLENNPIKQREGGPTQNQIKKSKKNQ